MDQEVLVLNNDFEPLNVCHTRRAIQLVLVGKAEVLHARDRYLRHLNGSFPVPAVVRMNYHVRRPRPELKLSRRTVFARDGYTCQYCGVQTRDLTIDHVVPRRLGGKTVWENVVAACRKCNTRKSDKPLEQSGLRLVRQPRRPQYVPWINLSKYLAGRKDQVWRIYLPHCTDLAD